MQVYDPAHTIEFHRFCVADKATELYRQAIAETVKAGDIVIDLGAGTGILAFFACQAGAQKVYAIEMGASIQLAKEICAKNDLQDKVICIEELSYRVDLPEKVDVLVTNTLAPLGLEGGLIGSVIDARSRLLKESGILIPQSLGLFVVPVEVPEFYNREIDFWSRDLHGLDFSPVRPFAANNLHRVRLVREAFLADPVLLTCIQFSEVSTPEVRGEVSFIAMRRGILHGLGGWFASELTEGVLLSNEPARGAANYHQAFLPLRSPISIEPGDHLRVFIHSYNGEVWRWRIEYQGQSRPDEDVHEHKIQVEHSTFWGFPLSKEEFHKRSSNYVPHLSQKGELELFILGLFDGKRTIAEIGQELRQHYPDSFHSKEESAAFVQEVIARCT